MENVNTTVCDCYCLSEKLLERFGSKLVLYHSDSPYVLAGEYGSFYHSSSDNYNKYCDEKTIFCCKYYKDEFLRVTVGNGFMERPIGHKLAALSDFYEILKEEFGVPTIFYTTKDDESGSLNFQWSMKEKEKDIEEFKNGTIFCDREVDQVIVIGERKIDFSKKILDSTTEEALNYGLGLPLELLPLVDENIEDFMKYKSGNDTYYTEEKPKEEKQKVYTYI